MEGDKCKLNSTLEGFPLWFFDPCEVESSVESKVGGSGNSASRRTEKALKTNCGET